MVEFSETSVTEAAFVTFQRGGALIHVVTDATPVEEIEFPDDIRRLRLLPASLLRERVTAAVRLYDEVLTEDGPQRVHKRPPDWLIKMIHERGEYPRSIRPITGVVTAPTMRSDGTIIQKSGYDAHSGLLVELSRGWPTIPERPTRDDAKRAAKELLEVIEDFPFLDEVHRSGWVSLVLTLLGRPAIKGPCPLFHIDANTAGSGKSLACDAAGIIATGQRLPRKTWPGDDDEMRKTITAVAIESLPIVLLDNIARHLGSASLDAALTGTTWSDRLLGFSKTTGTLPLTTVWASTGNNIQLVGDTARRTMFVRLKTDLENPEERTGFAHPDLIDWVRTERRRLAVAALTLLRAYVVAGRPKQNLPPWGSYEAWSDLIRQEIVWVGLPDPAGTRQIVREADKNAEILRIVLAGIEGAGEVTTADLLRLAEREPDTHPAVCACITELCGGDKEKQTASRLGSRLRAFVDRVCDGKTLTKRPGHGGVVIWSVRSSCGGLGDLGGDATSPPRAREQMNPQSEKYNQEIQMNTYLDGPAGSPPCPPSPPVDRPSCNHLDAATWIERDGRAVCPVCDRYMGRIAIK